MNYRKNKGFTLLFASLIVSLLLSVGLAILNITLEQLLLSSAAKESQFAFYNADTGIECALYYDRNGNGRFFATSTESNASGNLYSSITCNGVNSSPPQVTATIPDSNGGSSADTDIDLQLNPNDCPNSGTTPLIHLKISKVSDGQNIYTTIRSYGYNTCDSTSNRRVERGLLVNY